MVAFRKLLLLLLSIVLAANSALAAEERQNWRLRAAGFTEPADDGSGLDLDSFNGISTHLGRFSGQGAHMLFEDFTFTGYATYTAANGDQLDVVYDGAVTAFDVFPFPVEGDFVVVGGTGRFANATGCAEMKGSFTGVPGELFFELRGTLHPQGGRVGR